MTQQREAKYIIALISLQIFSQFFRARPGHRGHTVVANDWLYRAASVQITCIVAVGIPILDPSLLRALQCRLTTFDTSYLAHGLSVNSSQFIITSLLLATSST